jgi:LDH2 family malate/lactate/ureidoglycolate dehydrogenase
MPRYAYSTLLEFGTRVLEAAGSPRAEAAVVAESLLEADARGVASHGYTRLGAFAERLRRGIVRPGVTSALIRDTPSFLHVDGGNGMGVAVARQTMALCIERARTNGCCFAAINRANHFGIAAYYTLQAVEAGMAGIAMSNAPASTVPIGGRVPKLGTNPFAVAVPAGRRIPFCLDMATSVVAQGKVILAHKQGATSIPEGWAVDAEGRPTTDPAAALKGAMLPFGGAKGYGIALMIDLFCGALAGANTGTTIRSFWDDFENPQGLGLFLGAWNLGVLGEPAAVRARVDALLDDIKATPPVDGATEVFYAGEIEHLRAERSRREGIEFDATVARQIAKAAAAYGVAPPAPISAT